MLMRVKVPGATMANRYRCGDHVAVSPTDGRACRGDSKHGRILVLAPHIAYTRVRRESER